MGFMFDTVTRHCTGCSTECNRPSIFQVSTTAILYPSLSSSTSLTQVLPRE